MILELTISLTHPSAFLDKIKKQNPNHIHQHDYSPNPVLSNRQLLNNPPQRPLHIRLPRHIPRMVPNQRRDRHDGRRERRLHVHHLGHGFHLRHRLPVLQLRFLAGLDDREGAFDPFGVGWGVLLGGCVGLSGGLVCGGGVERV